MTTATKTISTLVIPADAADPAERRELENDYRALQQTVGGFIEVVPYHRDDDVAAYINEEGKLEQEPRINARATALLGPGLRAGDYIAGDCVVTGFDPCTGENRDLPDGFEAQLAIRRQLPEPLEEHDIADRQMSWKWELERLPGEHDGVERIRYAILSCGHRSSSTSPLAGGRRGSQFYAHVRGQSEERHDGIRSVRFALFGATGLVSEDVPRYSRRGFEAFSELALERLHSLYGVSDHRATKHFELASGGAL